MKKTGGVAAKVQKLQQQEIFDVSQVFLEIGENMSPISVGELTEEDETCLVKVTRSRKQ